MSRVLICIQFSFCTWKCRVSSPLQPHTWYSRPLHTMQGHGYLSKLHREPWRRLLQPLWSSIQNNRMSVMNEHSNIEQNYSHSGDMHVTPASSLCPQFSFPHPRLLQSQICFSLPVHLMSSNHIWPVPGGTLPDIIPTLAAPPVWKNIAHASRNVPARHVTSRVTLPRVTWNTTRHHFYFSCTTYVKII